MVHSLGVGVQVEEGGLVQIRAAVVVVPVGGGGGVGMVFQVRWGYSGGGGVQVGVFRWGGGGVFRWGGGGDQVGCSGGVFRWGRCSGDGVQVGGGGPVERGLSGGGGAKGQTLGGLKGSKGANVRGGA